MANIEIFKQIAFGAILKRVETKRGQLYTKVCTVYLFFLFYLYYVLHTLLQITA